MAVSVASAKFNIDLATSIASGTGARYNFSDQWEDLLTDSSDVALFDRLWVLADYSLTVAAGNYDIDLYDLASLDVGAGAGRDNLGLTHANARIIALAIRNQDSSTTSGTLRIDQVGATTTAWSGLGHADLQLDLAEGSTFAVYLGESGKTVTDTTDHILRLNAQTDTCTIDVAFWSKQS